MGKGEEAMWDKDVAEKVLMALEGGKGGSCRALRRDGYDEILPTYEGCESADLLVPFFPRSSPRPQIPKLSCLAMSL